MLLIKNYISLSLEMYNQIFQNEKNYKQTFFSIIIIFYFEKNYSSLRISTNCGQRTSNSSESLWIV